MNRRTLLKTAGAVTAAATPLYVLATRKRIRFRSSKRPEATKQRLVSGIPERAGNENELVGRIINTETQADEILDYENVPAEYVEDLQSGYESGFWVAIVSIQRFDSGFHPGKWVLDGEELIFPNVNRLPEEPERDGLYYHYEFLRFSVDSLVGDEPTEVTVTWD